MKGLFKPYIIVILLLLNRVVAFSDNETRDLIKRTGGVKEYPGANSLTVYDSTKVDVKESGLSYVNEHSLIKMLTGTGAMHYSSIKYGYDPLSAYVELKKVIIYRNDGKTEEIDLKNILDYPAPAGTILWGAREIMLKIGRLEPGEALEIFMFKKGFTYALLQDNDDDKFTPPMKGHFYDVVEFWTSEPIKVKVYQVSVPKDKNLQYEFYNGEVSSKSRIEGEKLIYTFTKKEILPIHGEHNMVAVSDVAPKLLLSTSPDWQCKSRWFYKVNEDYQSFECDPSIKTKVSGILKGATSEMDSISRLTHWVADEVRYFGLTMGKGEGYTLHKGSMTFTDRCGVCKDKAGMLVTMLRAAGFKAYPAMTMAGSRIENIPADQFNHSVSVVKLNNGKFMLLDPTWVPFVRELWSSLEQQQNYIIGTEKGEDLSITPISPPENHYLKITVNSELLPDGTLEGEIALEAEGQSDASFRASLVRNWKANWESVLKGDLLNDFPGIKISELKYPNPYDYSKPFSMKLKFKIADYATVTKDEIFFTPFVSSNLFKSRLSQLQVNTEMENRKYPFRDRCSRLVELKEVMKLPAYSKVNSIPKIKDYEGKVATFNGSYKIEGKQLEVYQKIILNKRVYEVEDWENFRKVVKSEKDLAQEKVILAK